MKISTTKSRIVSAFAVVALAGTVMVGAPSAAQATPQCLTANFVTSCVGVGADGAPYTFIAPANFNGTVFIYSHGLRPAIPIPATLGVPMGLGGAVAVTNAAEPGPGASSGDLSIINKLVASGYGVAGSGFSRQGINTTQALAANKELIATFKTKFPTTKSVIAWGASLGSLHSQILAEKNPELVDGVILGCPAANPQDALIAYFGDALWGFKALFDPSIMVGGYSADPTIRAGQQLQNIQKILVALGALRDGLSSGAWPATASPAGKALQAQGIPSRSALLAVGLMAGVATRSEHVDGTAGPVGATDTYPLAVAPAVAVLENMGATLNYGTFLTADAELLTGGKVYDNSNTDYAARIAADADIYSFALSGNKAVAGIISALAASPREKADTAAVVKLKDITSVTGKIAKPTLIFQAETESFVPSAIVQWYADTYAEQFAAEKMKAMADAKKSRSFVAPKNNLLVLWEKTAASYSKFTAAGTPDFTAPAGAGTGHCTFTPAQWLAAADLMVETLTNGKFPLGGKIKTTARKAGLSFDKDFRVPTFKALG